MHKCHMSCFLFLYFLFQDLNTTVPRPAVPKPQFPGSPLPPRCCLIGGSKTTHRMVHTEASCDWLRWYSTESDLLSKITMSQVGFFLFVCLLVWTWCILVPLLRPLPLQLCNSSPPHPWVSCWGWGGETSKNGGPVFFFFALTARKRTHLPLLFPSIRPAAVMSISEPERGGAGPTDQGSAVIGLCIDRWSGAASGSSPSSPHTPTPRDPIPTHFWPRIRAAGPEDRGGPPWPSTVRGWCSSGRDAGPHRARREEESQGRSRRGPLSQEGGPVGKRGGVKMSTKKKDQK